MNDKYLLVSLIQYYLFLIFCDFYFEGVVKNPTDFISPEYGRKRDDKRNTV